MNCLREGSYPALRTFDVAQPDQRACTWTVETVLSNQEHRTDAGYFHSRLEDRYIQALGPH